MLKLLLTFCVIFALTLVDNHAADTTKIRNRNAFLADKGIIAPLAHQCIANQSKLHLKPFTIQEFIALVERMENAIVNSTKLTAFNSADNVARMLLQRFNMDSVDFDTIEQDPNVEGASRIDTTIIGLFANMKIYDYDFPEYAFSLDETCTLTYMFSHNFVHTNNQTIEQGVVSFHHDVLEAIAPARVLAGIIAGMTDAPQTSGKAISAKLSGTAMQTEVELKDAILAVTFGNLMGISSFFDPQNSPIYNQSLVYGVNGAWNNESQYELQDAANIRALKYSHRASLAQIRGALDGYIIGSHLKKRIEQQGVKLSLSSILGLYYSLPQVGAFMDKLGVNYCDRADQMPSRVALNQVGSSYNRIFNYVFSKENSSYKGDLIYASLYRAANVQKDFCHAKPSPKKTYRIKCSVEEL